MPKIEHLSKNGVNSLISFLKELVDNHPGQDRLYLKPMIDVISEFEKKGPLINKEHKNFVPFKKIEGKKYKDIYELRTKKCRYLMYKIDNEHYVGLHGFEKKSNETPTRELDRAKGEIEIWKELRKM